MVNTGLSRDELRLLKYEKQKIKFEKREMKEARLRYYEERRRLRDEENARWIEERQVRDRVQHTYFLQRQEFLRMAAAGIPDYLKTLTAEQLELVRARGYVMVNGIGITVASELLL